MLDDYNMPHVQQVPRTDPEATIVGGAGFQFEQLSDQQATVQSPSMAGAGTYTSAEAGQPDYDQAFAELAESDALRKAQAEQSYRRRRTIDYLYPNAASLPRRLYN